MLALWLFIPLSLWIKPNGNITSVNEGSIIGRPIGCAIDSRGRFIHFEIIWLNKSSLLGLCNKALRHCENTKIAHKFRFKNPLYSLNASHIDLSLSLCEWAKVHESKASIKLTVGFNHSNTIPEFVALGDGIENDMVQGRALRSPSGSIVVYDKGYIDYQ